MKKLIFLFCALCMATQSFAEYNSNLTGTVAEVITYVDSDAIYLRLANQPTSESLPNSTCNRGYFVIATTVPVDRRQALLSRLLTAFASKEPVNIGFDGEGDCANGYIRVHRVG